MALVRFVSSDWLRMCSWPTCSSLAAVPAGTLLRPSLTNSQPAPPPSHRRSSQVYTHQARTIATRENSKGCDEMPRAA
eukprot:7630978-Pyramimonas_sp.AAC.1